MEMMMMTREEVGDDVEDMSGDHMEISGTDEEKGTTEEIQGLGWWMILLENILNKATVMY